MENNPYSLQGPSQRKRSAAGELESGRLIRYSDAGLNVARSTASGRHAYLPLAEAADVVQFPAAAGAYELLAADIDPYAADDEMQAAADDPLRTRRFAPEAAEPPYETGTDDTDNDIGNWEL